jgi:Pyruvate/2-oxoacid:ferredoxin oxidoreductase delta subunit
MKLESVREVFDEVIGDLPILYHLNVTTPTTPNKKRRLKTSTSFRADHIEFAPDCKSIIVWTLFSRVGPDYYFKNEILPKVIQKLNERYGGFAYDNYVLSRKQFAIRSGAGKLSKPSIVFSPIFGLQTKMDLIVSSHEFEETVVIENDVYYKNCEGCDAPCESQCPMKCTMNYELGNWEDCANFVDTQYMFDHPNEICKICQDVCPYSNSLIQDIDIKYGQFIDPKFLHLN